MNNIKEEIMIKDIKQSNSDDDENMDNEEEQCLMCSRWFSSEDALMDHIDNHNKKPKVRKFKENRAVPPNKDPYVKFLVKKSKSGDENSERDAYQCPLCCKSYGRIPYFKEHLKNVHNKCLEDFESSKQCEECGLWFINDDTLKDHLAKHVKDEIKAKPKQDMFTFIPKRKKSDKKKRRDDFEKDRSALTCSECKTTFTRRANLYRHMRTQHGIEANMDRHRKLKEEHVCKICDMIFTRKLNMQRHLQIHCNEENFECYHCGKSFSRKQHIAEHIHSVHMMSMTFECPKCMSSFSRKTHLKEHFLSHFVDDRPHKCDVCGQTFTQKTNLTTHLKFHKGVRSYSCIKCGMNFVKKQHLQRHKERRNH